MERLFIINLYGTIIPEQGKPIARAGFHKFLQDHEHVLVSAYKPSEIARSDLDAIGVPHTLPVFGLEDKFFYGLIEIELAPIEDAKTALSGDIDKVEALYERHKREALSPNPDKPYVSQELRPMFSSVVREYNEKAGSSFRPKDAVVVSDNPNDIKHAMQRRVSRTIGTVIEVPTFIDESDTFSFDHVDSLRHRIAHHAINALGLGPYKIRIE